MEWKDAITEVLKGVTAPMHYTEIADQIVQRNLRNRDELGAIPASTVNSIITSSINSETDNSPFRRTSRGYYMLRGVTLEVPTPEQEQAEAAEVTGLVNAFGMFWERSKISWNHSLKYSANNRRAPVWSIFADRKASIYFTTHKV